jgi:hypothetical protein
VRKKEHEINFYLCLPTAIELFLKVTKVKKFNSPNAAIPVAKFLVPDWGNIVDSAVCIA